MFRFPWLLLFAVAVRSDAAESIDNPKDVNAVAASPAENSGDSRLHGSRRTQVTMDNGNWKLQNCYTCSDCEHIQFNTTVTACPYNSDTAKMHKCITYVEQYSYFGKPWYVRGCASAKGSCADLKKNHDDAQYDTVKLISCNECEGDLCNSVSRSLPLALLYFVVTPILTKLVLS